MPPSESKRLSPEHGSPIDVDALSFPTLRPLRERILAALIETSQRTDAFQRLFLRPSFAAHVARNTRLRELPTRPVLEVYRGPLHQGLDAASFGPDVAARANRQLVVASSLWGALRPSDSIPTYRLNICSRLVGLDRLEPTWRTIIPDVLSEAAGPDGVVLDLRSPSYQAIGMPNGLADRTVSVSVARNAVGGARVGDVVAKRVRGEAARHLLEISAEPAEPGDLADILADRWPVELRPPSRRGDSWTLRLTVDG